MYQQRELDLETKETRGLRPAGPVPWRLDRIIDLKHDAVSIPLEWKRPVEPRGKGRSNKPGQPTLPKRLKAGFHVLKSTFELLGMQVVTW